MKLKDSKFKYKLLEIVVMDRDATFFKPVGVMTDDMAKLLVGDYEVASVRDFKDTKTTSVLIYEEEKKWERSFVS